jgi:hypothetical protein
MIKGVLHEVIRFVFTVVSMSDLEKDKEFIEQFEKLLQQVEEVILRYPPELRPALRDEARVALRLQLQERWEAAHRLSEGRGGV